MSIEQPPSPKIIRSERYTISFSTERDIQARNSIFEKSIETDKNISFSGITALGTVQSYNGKFDSKNSSLAKVFAKTSATLTDSSATALNVKSGEIIWNNKEIKSKEATSIKASGDISLIKVTCNGILQSFKGNISPLHSVLMFIHAEKAINLKESSANLVVSNTDTITISCPSAPIKNVHAAKDIFLDRGSFTGLVKSVEGSITAKSSSFFLMKSKKDIILEEASGGICISYEGSIRSSNEENNSTKIEQLVAKGSIEVIYTNITQKIISKTDKVFADNCTIHTIKAVSKIRLLKSVAEEAFLSLKANVTGQLDLEDSSIRKDFTIKLNEEELKSWDKKGPIKVKISGGSIHGKINILSPVPLNLQSFVPVNVVRPILNDYVRLIPFEITLTKNAQVLNE